jgi:beta-glucosidase
MLAGLLGNGPSEPKAHQRPLDEMIREALSVSQNADVIIAALGELNSMNGEGSSRSDISLPEPQKKLLKALGTLGKPVVLLLSTGRPMVLTEEDADPSVNAIVCSWNLGSEAGNAVADVLFGDVNPSAKITATFPRSVGQLPTVYYNHKPTGRPWPDYKGYQRFSSNYQDIINAPLYPFGYGLSYTTFSYGDVSLSASSMPEDGTVTASVTVTNTGSRQGVEIVQMYIRDIYSTSTRPVKELKGFQRVSLEPGESKVVSFKIDADLLSYYNHELEWVSEPGDFDIMIGGNSRDVKSARLTLK